MRGPKLNCLSAFAITGAICLIALPATAQTPIQIAELLSDDGAAGDLFGWSVAISGDTAIFGATGDDEFASSSGAAYVFVRSGDSWIQQAKLLPDDGAEFDQFGYAVAVSGITAVIGAGLLNGSGFAYVFVRNGTTWTQQAKLIPGDGTVDSQFGFSIALSGDTAVFGAYGDDELALFAGADGLDELRRLVTDAHDRLVDGGWLVLEIGADQGDAVRSLLRRVGYAEIEIRGDLSGLDRIALGRRQHAI